MKNKNALKENNNNGDGHEQTPIHVYMSKTINVSFELYRMHYFQKLNVAWVNDCDRGTLSYNNTTRIMSFSDTYDIYLYCFSDFTNIIVCF